MTPTALLGRVEIRKDCIGYYNTFAHLDKRRNYNTAGVQPLQVSEVLMYLAEGLDIPKGDERDKHLHLVLEMDNTTMEHHFEKASKKAS